MLHLKICKVYNVCQMLAVLWLGVSLCEAADEQALQVVQKRMLSQMPR
jgi:hypothetical protein